MSPSASASKSAPSTGRGGSRRLGGPPACAPLVASSNRAWAPVCTVTRPPAWRAVPEGRLGDWARAGLCAAADDAGGKDLLDGWPAMPGALAGITAASGVGRQLAAEITGAALRTGGAGSASRAAIGCATRAAAGKSLCCARGVSGATAPAAHASQPHQAGHQACFSLLQVVNPALQAFVGALQGQ